jgi:hypothetical protein
MPTCSSKDNYKQNTTCPTCDGCGEKAVFVLATRRKMCDVRFVPHSCCLLSLTFLKHVPTRKWQKSKYPFSQAYPYSNMTHCNDHISIHPPHPPHKNTHHTNIISNMADRLPLAKLSIQNKQPTPPTETTQPIKTKKNCPLQSPKLPHPWQS